jgi:hypothetical protein
VGPIGDRLVTAHATEHGRGGERQHGRQPVASPLGAARIGEVYGDQGLFASRAAFERAGGFAEEPLFEEVPLVRALKRAGGFRVLDEPIVVSARRWQQDGFWRRTLENRLLALGHAAGLSPRRLARWYRRVKDG